MNTIETTLAFEGEEWRLILTALRSEVERRQRLSQRFYRADNADLAFAVALDAERLAGLAKRIADVTGV